MTASDQNPYESPQSPKKPIRAVAMPSPIWRRFFWFGNILIVIGAVIVTAAEVLNRAILDGNPFLDGNPYEYETERIFGISACLVGMSVAVFFGIGWAVQMLLVYLSVQASSDDC
jgi:hypothetical protein